MIVEEQGMGFRTGVRLPSGPLNESEANTTRILYFRGVVSFVFNWKVFAEH